MKIRLANPNDAISIQTIFQEAFGPFKHLYTPGAYSHTAVKEGVIKQRMQQGKTWIAEENGDALGTVTVMETWEGFYVAGMAVSPKAQGKKLAYRLMRELEDFVRTQNADRIYLYTTTFLDRAIALYEKFGFTRYGNPTDEYLGTVLIQFEKQL